MNQQLEDYIWSQYLNHVTHGSLVITGDPAQVACQLVEVHHILRQSLDPPGIDYAAAAIPGAATPNPEPPNARAMDKLMDIEKVFTHAFEHIPQKFLDAWVDVRMFGLTQQEAGNKRRISQQAISKQVAKCDKALHNQLEKRQWTI